MSAPFCAPSLCPSCAPDKLMYGAEAFGWNGKAVDQPKDSISLEYFRTGHNRKQMIDIVIPDPIFASHQRCKFVSNESWRETDAGLAMSSDTYRHLTNPATWRTNWMAVGLGRWLANEDHPRWRTVCQQRIPGNASLSSFTETINQSIDWPVAPLSTANTLQTQTPHNHK